MKKNDSIQQATFAGGCFWCTEAIFKRVKGVTSVVPGYAGGDTENPSYEEVSSGSTGHAEAVQLTFEPSTVSFDKLLDIFFATHDPTSLNRQGADVGTQYRSAIFYHNGSQKNDALEKKKEIEKKYSDPVVTEIAPYSNFYSAEKYHINYYDSNRNYPYCTAIIDPKITKLFKNFENEIKEEYKK